MYTKQSEKLLKLMKSKGGLIRSSELAPEKIPRRALKELLEEGQIERVLRGVYRLKNQDFQNDELAAIFKIKPHGILCLLSALHFHNLGTEYPQGIWIALKQGEYAPKIKRPKLHVVRFSKEGMTYGVEKHEIDGTLIKVTSPARTVADCFKYRNKIGLDVAIEALSHFWRQRKQRGFSADDLTKAAKFCRVQKIMRPFQQGMIS